MRLAAGWILLLSAVFLAACAGNPPPAQMNAALPENPLAACPETPNCVRETHLYPDDAATLYARARTALEAAGAAEVEAFPEEYRLHAVFRVLFFKDDVDLLVTAQTAGSALHIRSASRVGRSDLGVNRRRVRKILSDFGI